jgi:addiction module RelE/StbE family toxin
MQVKKIIQRTKRFEKSFVKLSKKAQAKFIERLEIFIENENSSLLKTHQLKGEMKEYYAFSVTGDIRAIYKKEVRDNKTILIFTFIDIGGHSKVY